MRSWKLFPLVVSSVLLVGCSPGFDGDADADRATPTPTSTSEDQPELTESQAVQACVDEWRAGATGRMPDYEERWDELYSTEKAVTTVADGEWRIALVPSERPTGEWNLYCLSDGLDVDTAEVGYEQWPS